VLDDLHWADAPSLAMLRFVGRELEGAGPLVVGVYRHTEVDRGHPLLATLADLARGQHHRRLLLGGLDQREVASFVALVAGVEPPPGLAAAVHRQTDGNPFFVTEVVRLLASQDRLGALQADSLAPAVELPEGVRVVVAQRLGRLSDGCRRLLEVAAVVGRDFQLRVLQPASGLDAERLLRLLEEAEAARMIGAVPGGLGRWRFAHALVREVLYEGLPAAGRVRLHGRASGRRWRRSTRPTRGRTWPSWPTTASPRRPAAERWWPGRCRQRPWRGAAPWTCSPGRRRPACSNAPWPRSTWPSGPISASVASCCCPWGRRGWRPATCLPPAPPTGRPAS
jgi:hypothetical protein